jgi:hypothetical protein
MIGNATTIAGIPVPSDARLFLAFIHLHIVAGLTAVIAGAIAMPSAKCPGRHPRAGTVYYCGSCRRFRHNVRSRVLPMERGLSPVHAGVCVVCRHCDWPGCKAKTVAILAAHSYHWNGRVLPPDDHSLLCGQRANLPVWRELPPLAFWLLPTLVGAPILINALLRHPLVTQIGSNR